MVGGEDLLDIGTCATPGGSSVAPLPGVDPYNNVQQAENNHANKTPSYEHHQPTIVSIPPRIFDDPAVADSTTSAGLSIVQTSSRSIFLDSITSILPPSFTSKCTLPDKTVASQVLMYRQLLHTACKPGLRLSRPFEGTKAQRSVMYMPWWEKNVELTKRMVISYDNLITRVWIYGSILPYVNTDEDNTYMAITTDDTTTSKSSTNNSNSRSSTTTAHVIEEAKKEASSQHNTTNVNQACISRGIDTMMNTDTGLPPIPHEYWVTRAGFQQDDPVTDFRSGGVLSLAMLLHIVESCPLVHARFIQPTGDASVLPFGITSINVTDMLAKICMFSKAVDKMDALLSSKPFWRMFSDPNSLLALQELSMDMLADVVVELGKFKKWHILEDNEHMNLPSKMMDPPRGVTVFDFPDIMETLEKRVRDDLLGSGPRDIVELRQIAHRLRVRYQKESERKERAAMKRMQERHIQKQSTVLGENTVASVASASALNAVNFFKETAAGTAEGFFNRFKGSVTLSSNSSSAPSTANQQQGTCFQFARPVVNDNYYSSSHLPVQENISNSAAEKDLISF